MDILTAIYHGGAYCLVFALLVLILIACTIISLFFILAVLSVVAHLFMLLFQLNEYLGVKILLYRRLLKQPEETELHLVLCE